MTESKKKYHAPSRGRASASEPRFKGPTAGLENIVFDHGESMRTGEWKGNVEALASRVSQTIKYGGPRVSKAMKKMKFDELDEPEEPDAKATRKQLAMFELRIKEYGRKLLQDEENNQVAYEFIMSHCTPKMKMKLEAGADWESIEEAQDGVGLLKALHDVYFGQDGAKQGMHEIVHAAKRLHLCY